MTVLNRNEDKDHINNFKSKTKVTRLWTKKINYSVIRATHPFLTEKGWMASY